MKRRRITHLGDLEKYGLLALAAALLLGVAYLVQAIGGTPMPFREVAFAADRPLVPETPPILAERSSRGAPVAAPPGVDAPGGGDARHGAAPASRPDFDFFEAPIRLPGQAAPVVPLPPGRKLEGARKVVIRQGDTLRKIAARELGDAERWTLLVQANPGIDPKRLQLDQEIEVPTLPLLPAPAAAAAAPAARLYDVQSGDTLQSIALALYGDRARWIDLLEANRDVVQDPATLKAGSKLRIP